MPKKSTSKKRKSNGKNFAKVSAAKKLPQVKEPLSKSATIKAISEATCLSKKEVGAVLDCLHQVIEKHVRSGGPGSFVIPKLMKIVVKKKPAQAAYKGINPFTGEEMTFKAKPARRVIKIRPLKAMKEMVS